MEKYKIRLTLSDSGTFLLSLLNPSEKWVKLMCFFKSQDTQSQVYIQHGQKPLGSVRLTLPSDLFSTGKCPHDCISKPQERKAKWSCWSQVNLQMGWCGNRGQRIATHTGFRYFFQLFTAQKWHPPSLHLLPSVKSDEVRLILVWHWEQMLP